MKKVFLFSLGLLFVFLCSFEASAAKSGFLLEIEDEVLEDKWYGEYVSEAVSVSSNIEEAQSMVDQYDIQILSIDEEYMYESSNSGSTKSSGGISVMSVGQSSYKMTTTGWIMNGEAGYYYIQVQIYAYIFENNPGPKDFLTLEWNNQAFSIVEVSYASSRLEALYEATGIVVYQFTDLTTFGSVTLEVKLTDYPGAFSNVILWGSKFVHNWSVGGIFIYPQHSSGLALATTLDHETEPRLVITDKYGLWTSVTYPYQKWNMWQQLGTKTR